MSYLWPFVPGSEGTTGAGRSPILLRSCFGVGCLRRGVCGAQRLRLLCPRSWFFSVCGGLCVSRLFRSRFRGLRRGCRFCHCSLRKQEDQHKPAVFDSNTFHSLLPPPPSLWRQQRCHLSVRPAGRCQQPSSCLSSSPLRSVWSLSFSLEQLEMTLWSL